MGAEAFMVTVEGDSPKAAFDCAVRDAVAGVDCGFGFGSISEKYDFVMIDVPEHINNAVSDVDGMSDEEYRTTRIRRYCEDLIDSDDYRIADKWGPAGCVELKPGTYIFFGWAPS